jgi:hypothetical protein
MRNLDSKVVISHFYWQRMGLFILWLISLCFVAFTIHQSLLKIGICLAILAIFTVWGHVIVYPIHYKNGRVLEGFVWGTISGIALASLMTSVIVFVTGWNLLVIFGSVTVLPALLLSMLIKRVGSKNRLQTGRDLDLRILLLALIVVTLFFYFPFKNLGARVDDKYLYAWLFGHDFINRMVHVNSLSLGLPLDSFFFSGEKLSYYWLAYVYPALIRNVTWINLDLKQILQVTQLFYSLLTTAGLAIFLNRFVDQRRLLIVLMVLAFCCYSYVGLLVSAWEGLKSVYGPMSLHFLGYDLARFSRFSHTFYRFFLVEPQSTLGIAIMLMILAFYDKKGRYYEFIIVGLLLGLLFGVEATNGIMVILWFAGMTLFTVFINKNDRYPIFQKHTCALICGGLISLVLFAIHMYSFQTGRGALKLSVNWFPVITGPFYFIFAYGPIFLFGIAGLYGIFKQRESSDHFVYQYILLFGISVAFVFFIKNPTEPHFGLIKATRIIPICLLVLSAYFFQNIFRTRMLHKTILVLILLALPTLFTDNFIASDISNPSTYVRYSDMEAAKWIKRNLPRETIIQAEPNYPGKQGDKSPIYAYSFIPIFSERRTAIGEWRVSHQEHSRGREVGQRFHSIKKMYSTASLSESTEIIKRYDIDYVYIGELERELYPEGIAKFMNGKHFQLIYLKGNVAIYRFVS